MSVRKDIPEYDGLYFITFTCARWIKLFEIANGYNTVYKWFDYLKSRGHFIVGYVIMPNHVHALIAFRNTQGQSINSIIGTGKRFMAYGIIQLLEQQQNSGLLNQLSSMVNATEKSRMKLHQVFEPSFDWKLCTGREFIEQKLNYIHYNPCRGHWNLAANPADYLHSSALYYLHDMQGVYEVISYTELEDVDLTKAMVNQ